MSTGQVGCWLGGRAVAACAEVQNGAQVDKFRQVFYISIYKLSM